MSSKFEFYPINPHKFLREDDDILLAGDFEMNFNDYANLLRKLSLRPGRVRVITQRGEFERALESVQAEDIEGVINDLCPASPCYLQFEHAETTIYNDPHSNISFVVAAQTLLKDSSAQWDANFSEHLARSGVGFGEEGKAYSRALLLNLAKAIPSQKDRFQRLLAVI